MLRLPSLFGKAVTGLVVALLAFMMVPQGLAMAQSYPTKPIRVIVPWGAGSATDVGARVLQRHAERHGLKLVIENRAGASGRVGFAEIARSRPDGYTIGFLNLPTAIMYTIEGSVPYKPTDFEPIIGQVTSPRLLVVGANSPFNSIQEFVAYAAENPRSLKIAAGGPGSNTWYTAKLTEEVTGVEFTLVPMDGFGEATAALMGGHIDAIMVGPEEMRNVEDLKALALYAWERLPNMPEVPTMLENGWDIVMAAYRVVVAPKGTPAEVIEYLYNTLKTVQEDPEYIADIERLGLILDVMSPEDVRAEMASQAELYARLMKE